MQRETEILFYFDSRHPFHVLKDKPKEIKIPEDHFIDFVNKIDGLMGDPIETNKFLDIHLKNNAGRKRTFLNSNIKEWYKKVRNPSYTQDTTVFNDFGCYKIKHRDEVNINPVDITSDNLDQIVVKLRRSYNFDENWRLDISGVRKCDLKDIGVIKETFEKHIGNRFTDYNHWDYFEFELELLPHHQQYIVGDEFETVVKTFYKKVIYWINFEYQDLLLECAKLMGNKKTIDQIIKNGYSLRNIGTLISGKAVEPSLDDYFDRYIWGWSESSIFLKIDGTREILYINGPAGKMCALGCNNINAIEWFAPPEGVQGTYIFDTEFQNGIWYILHIWYYSRQPEIINKSDIEQLDFLQQSLEIKTDLNELFNVTKELAITPYIASDKKPNSAKELNNWILSNSKEIKNDGLIISTPWGPIKWKDPQHSTYDLLIVNCPEWLCGKTPFISDSPIYLLCGGIKTNKAEEIYPWFSKFLKRWLNTTNQGNSDYIYHPFCPNNNPEICIYTMLNVKHGQIGEFRYDAKTNKLVLDRIRNDKHSVLTKGGTDMGNDQKTLHDVYSKIIKPFPIDYLFPGNNKLQTYMSDINNANLLKIPVELQEYIISTENDKTIIFKAPLLPNITNGKNKQKIALLYSQELINKISADMAPYHIQYPGKRLTKNNAMHKLPKQFVGGCDIMVASSDAISDIAIWSYIKSTGILIIISNVDVHLGGKNDLLKISEEEWQNPSDIWNPNQDPNISKKYIITIIKKMVRGTADMAQQNIIEENPHLHKMTNEPNFKYKYMRQKTKDICGLAHLVSSNLESLCINPQLGQLLCYIEFICDKVKELDTNILLLGPQILQFTNELKKWYPTVVFVTVDDIYNIPTLKDEISYIMSSPEVPYSDVIDAIKNYEPLATQLFFSAETLEQTGGKIIKPGYGCVSYIPFDNPNSSMVALYVNKNPNCETWNILPNMFRDEMHTFHGSYRCSCFKYMNKPSLELSNCYGIKLDNCYDCKVYAHIMNKYYIRNIKLDI